ncbi:MAG: hypothetical protein K6L73_10065 [Cellvibrionaceae bacterium]
MSLTMESLTRNKILLAISTLTLALYGGLVQAQEDEGWSDDWGDTEFSDEEKSFVITGFVEGAYGGFVDHNTAVGSRESLNEGRLRLETEKEFGSVVAKLKADGYHDGVEGKTSARIREAVVSFSPRSDMDVKLGRQILTWGTGDLVFLNDLFPKDWQSFFSGRDQEYLKAPSDALKWSWFNSVVNIDVVWSPRFDSDSYLTGERFSYFSPLSASVTGDEENGVVNAEKPSDDEWAVRLYQNTGSVEWAFYGYQGYGKQPKAVNTVTFEPRFYELQVMGASVRSPLFGGIANMETAWHLSKEDRDGSDPFISNDQWRFLIGYEHELLPRLTPKLTLSMQYYLEKTQDYNTQQRNAFFPKFETPENRDLVTVRLTKQMLQDNLTLSLFMYYSPAEQDSYVMPSVNYRYSDQLSFSFGGNFYEGEDSHSFFGQLENNSNLYGRVRYSF